MTSTTLPRPRPELGQRQLRSRTARAGAGAVAVKPKLQHTSDEISAAVYSRDIYAFEVNSETDASPAVADSSILQTGGSSYRKRKESPSKAFVEAAMADSRRNPKRKATETAATATAAIQEARDYQVLLREALKPISTDELQEWEGWCEVESEPVGVELAHSGIQV